MFSKVFLGFVVFSFSFSSKYVFFFLIRFWTVFCASTDFFTNMQFSWLKFFIEFVCCLYFLCNFSIKPLTCIVFDSDSLKRSYVIYDTVKPGNKITISNIRIIKVFINREWNSLQGLFIHIRRVILQRAKSYFLVSVVFCFRDFSSAIYQRVIWYRSMYQLCLTEGYFPQYLLKCAQSNWRC